MFWVIEWKKPAGCHNFTKLYGWSIRVSSSHNSCWLKYPSQVLTLPRQICDTKIMHKNNFDQNKRSCVLWCIIIKHVNKLQCQEVYILCDSMQHYMQIITIIMGLWSPWYWSSLWHGRSKYYRWDNDVMKNHPSLKWVVIYTSQMIYHRGGEPERALLI